MQFSFNKICHPSSPYGSSIIRYIFYNFIFDRNSLKLYLLFSVVTSLVMFAELYMVIFYHNFTNEVNVITSSELNNTYYIGLTLFTDYIFSFEVTAFILLVAIIAAIAINMTEKQRSLRQDPGKQILESKKSRLRIIKGNKL